MNDDGDYVDNASSSLVCSTTTNSAADYAVDTKAQTYHELEDDASSHYPIPLNLPLPALARIIHYFSTSSSWPMTSWNKPNLDVVSSVLAEDIQVNTRANADADADCADALLCAMDFPGFELGPLGAVSASRNIYGWQSGSNEKCHVSGDSSIRSFLRLFAAATLGGANDSALMALDALVDRTWVHSPEGQLDLLLGLLQMDRRCTWTGGDRNDITDAHIDGRFWDLLSDEEKEDVNQIIAANSSDVKEYDGLPNPIGLTSTKILYRVLQFPDHVGNPSLGEKIMKFLFGAHEGELGVVARCPEALICSFTRLDRQFMAGAITLGTRGRRFMMDAVDRLRTAYFWPIQESSTSARIVRTRSAVYRRLWEVAPDEVEFACLKLWHAVVARDGVNIPTDRTMLSIAISQIAFIIQQSADIPAAISTIIDGQKDFEYQFTVGMFLADALVLDLSEWLVNCAKIPKSGRIFVESILRFAEREFVRSRPRKAAWKDSLTVLSLENLAGLLHILPKSDVCVTRPRTKRKIKCLLKKCLVMHGRDRHFIRSFKRSTLPTIEEGGDNEDDDVMEEYDATSMCQLESSHDSFLSHPLESTPEIMEYEPTWDTAKSPAKKKWSSPTSVKDIANISASCSTPMLINAESSLDAHNFPTSKKNNVPIGAHTLKEAFQSASKKAGGSTIAEPIDLSFVSSKVKTTLDGILVHIDAAADRLMAASLATAGPAKSRALCLAEIPRDHAIKGYLLDAALYVEKAMAEVEPNGLKATEHDIGLFAKAILDNLYEGSMHSEPFRLEVHVGLLELILARMPKLKPSLIAWTKSNHAVTNKQSEHHVHVVSLLVCAGLIEEEGSNL